jgi:hypothetical protein
MSRLFLGWVGAGVGAWLGAGVALADDRGDIEAVLGSMSAAVMAGDQEGYLRNVDLRDPEFAMEQRHWAADLDRHKPLAFVMEIVDEPETHDDDPAIGADRGTMTLRMRYRMDTGHASGENGKRAEWPGVFVKRDVDGDGPEPARWLYAGENWAEERGEYGDKDKGTYGTFVVEYLPGSERVAADVVRAFPGAKAHADEGFGVNITRRLQIKLYQSMEHLKAWVYLSMPDNILGGWNEPGESIKFMASYTSGVERWRAAFGHEYGHVATWEFGPKVKSMPWWMAEGVAELSAEEFTHDREAVHQEMVRRTRKGTVCAWGEISDYDKAEQRVKRMAYIQGHDLMGYVSERWGRGGRNKWIREAAQGTALSEATRKALGVTFEELDAAWRRSLEEELVGSRAGEDAKARTPSGGG